MLGLNAPELPIQKQIFINCNDRNVLYFSIPHVIMCVILYHQDRILI